MSDHIASLKSRHKFSLNWGYLNAITSGMSAIDLRSLALRNLHDARQFAREYGFDLDQPANLEWIRRAHREAVDFIASHFLAEGQAGLIPPEVRLADDPLQLLVYASQRAEPTETLRMWSCAVLKVMHGIFYIDSDLKLRHFTTKQAPGGGGAHPRVRARAAGLDRRRRPPRAGLITAGCARTGPPPACRHCPAPAYR